MDDPRGWRTARDAVLRQRADLHLVTRLCARVYQLVAPSGVAHRPSLILAALAWAAVDVALAVVLRRTKRGLLAPRVVLDAADAAFWTFWVPGGVPYTQFALASAISIAESGFRRGLARGVLAAAVVSVGVCAGRTAAGHELALIDTAMFTVWPAVAGWVLALYIRGRAAEAAADAERQAQAQIRAVELQARSLVQIGRGGAVIDAVQRGWWFLSLAGDQAAVQRRAAAQGHKGTVAAQVRGQAAYLRDVLDAFAAEVRESEVDTRRHVTFRVPVDDGLTVLTAEQARAVRAALAATPMTGSGASSDFAVEVRVVARDLSDGSFTLAIDSTELAVPPSRRRRRLFLAPAAFLLAGTLALVQADPVYTAAPWGWCVADAAVLALTAWVVQRMLARRGRVRLGAVALLAVLPVSLEAALGAAGRHGPLADGRVLIPVLGGLTGWAFVIGTVQPFIRGRWTALSATLAFAVVTVAVLTYPAGLPTVGGFAADFIFPVVALVGSRLMSVGTVTADDLVQRAVLANLPLQAETCVRTVVQAELSTLERELEALAAAVRETADGEWRDAADTSLREAGEQFTRLCRTGIDQIVQTLTSSGLAPVPGPTLG